MNRKFYVSLAKNNIKKNRSAFYPFALSAVAMIAMYYMISAVSVWALASEGFYGAATIRSVLNLGRFVCGIFAAGVIFYTNGFLMKQRAKELGLYSILGMEKRHIAKVLCLEIVILGSRCIFAGLFFGILFSRLMFLFLMNLMKLNAAFHFGISGTVIVQTIVIFGLVFCANILQDTVKLKFVKPIDLLKSGSQGEKEPKAKWLRAVLSLICLGTGYYIAVTTKNPIQAISVFFVAALLVMAGTYLLFLSGSIAILKLLKKSKKYYYHKTHFVSVSGMMYRMKRNAVGLSNICILSTAVLVVFSSAVSLYMGNNDYIASAYPRDIMTAYLCPTEAQRMKEAQDAGIDPIEALDTAEVEKAILTHAEINQVTVSNIFQEFSLFLIARETEKNVFIEERSELEASIMMNMISQKEYNRNEEKNRQLEELPDGWVWAADSEGKLSDGDEISLCGRKLRVKLLSEHLTQEEMQRNLLSGFSVLESEFRCVFLVLPSREDLETMADLIHQEEEREERIGVTQIEYDYLFNVSGEEENITAFCSTLRNALNDAGIPHVAGIGDVFTERKETQGMYGSVFFIGIFMSVMFLLATVLIIYYKQISEGYEDRGRFEILQKVGMGKKEVQKVITTQILQVFFLPILLGTVHIAFAFPIIRRILAILGLINVKLFILCTIGSILIFLLVYGIVYYLTAGAYYKIVYSKQHSN